MAFITPKLTEPETSPDPATPLALTDLHGVVDFRASILDHPVHTMSGPPGPQNGLAPSVIRATLAPVDHPSEHYGSYFLWDGATVMPASAIPHTWAYGTFRQNGCYYSPTGVCGIEINWHVGGKTGFDTRRVPNGTYLYCIAALQIEGHRSNRCTAITIHN
jgi:hypothetical protein